VANFGSDNVRKPRASDGFVLGTYGAGNMHYGIAFDDTNIWDV
jgi:hypothetical protein